MELNQLLESGKDIDYSKLETRISTLYNRKQKVLNEFEEKYDKIIPRIVITPVPRIMPHKSTMYHSGYFRRNIMKIPETIRESNKDQISISIVASKG